MTVIFTSCVCLSLSPAGETGIVWFCTIHSGTVSSPSHSLISSKLHSDGQVVLERHETKANSVQLNVFQSPRGRLIWSSEGGLKLSLWECQGTVDGTQQTLLSPPSSRTACYDDTSNYEIIIRILKPQAEVTGGRLEWYPLDKKVLGLTGVFGLLSCRLRWCKGLRFSPRSRQNTEPQNILSVWVSPFSHFFKQMASLFRHSALHDVTAVWPQFWVYLIQVCSCWGSRRLCYTNPIPAAAVSLSVKTLSGCPLWVAISTIMYLPYIIYSRCLWLFPRGNTRGETPSGSLVLLVGVKKKKNLVAILIMQTLLGL